MRRFFQTLYCCLTRGGRAVLQIYPENAIQVCFTTRCAQKAPRLPASEDIAHIKVTHVVSSHSSHFKTATYLGSPALQLP